MNAHTPGPWATSRDAVPPGFTQVTIYAEHTGQRVATAFETEANARLIAAAPDYHEAARKVLAAWECGDLASAVRELAAVHAKAEGRA